MWLKPQGYGEIITPVKDIVRLDHIRKEAIPAGIAKYDTCTCNHCNSMFHVSARMHPADIGGLCKSCMKPICPKCLDKPCVPWEKYLDEMDEAYEKQRTIKEWFG